MRSGPGGPGPAAESNTRAQQQTKKKIRTPQGPGPPKGQKVPHTRLKIKSQKGEKTKGSSLNISTPGGETKGRELQGRGMIPKGETRPEGDSEEVASPNVQGGGREESRTPAPSHASSRAVGPQASWWVGSRRRLRRAQEGTASGWRAGGRTGGRLGTDVSPRTGGKK